ncbi:MAG: biotin transporter BioY [Anaerolineales bacterium]|nr:biotin transporter BioY [Anaerolineales bacterium]
MTTLAPTLYQRAFPRNSNLVRDLTLVLLGSWLVALLAQIKFALPFSPVPVTAQTFGVLLIGAALGSKRGVAAVLAYLAQGAAGAPFFAGGVSGLSVFSGATAGYLLGFVGAAYVVGLLAERGMERRFKTSLAPFFVGTLIIYACGVLWLTVLFGGDALKALQVGLLPFLVGDAFKLIAAAVALPAAWKALR